nr:type II toxin-antitoxin system RelE/ParE family toxin [Pseudopedobacter sp.]
MKVIFHDEHLGMLAEKQATGKSKFPTEVIISFRKKLAFIRAAGSTQDLRKMSSLHFEKLTEKKYLGMYSIRLNRSYRLILSIDNEDNLEIIIIEEINNHYS